VSNDFSPVQTTSNISKSNRMLTITFGSTPTSGNLLVIGYARSHHTPFTTPVGWTAVDTITYSSNSSAGLIYRVSNGTETSITLGSSGTGNNQGLFAEYPATGVTSVTDSSNNTGTDGTAECLSITDDQIKVGIAFTDGTESASSVDQSHIIDVQNSSLVFCSMFSGDKDDGVTPTVTLSASNDWGTIYGSFDADPPPIQILRLREMGY